MDHNEPILRLVDIIRFECMMIQWRRQYESVGYDLTKMGPGEWFVSETNPNQPICIPTPDQRPLIEKMLKNREQPFNKIFANIISEDDSPISRQKNHYVCPPPTPDCEI